VADKSNFRGSGTFTYQFTDDDCTNDKPTGDCDAMFSKAAHDNGENEGPVLVFDQDFPLEECYCDSQF
jgi:hypothetical protein